MTTFRRRSTFRALRSWVTITGLLALGAAAANADDLKDGKTALQAGDYDRAIASFEKAASQGLAEGRAGVGQVYLRRRQYPKAMEAFQTAQKMDPNLAMAWYGQGEVFHRTQKCDTAVPLLQKAVDLDKKFPEAQLALGECLTELKKVDAALAALNPGTKWGPKWRPRFLVAMGYAEQSRDSLRSASVYFTQAREESPTDPIPRRALGDFYMKSRGIAELAIPEYEAAVALDSSDVDLRFSLAQGLYYGQRYQEALEEYKWVVQRDPDFAPGQLGLGNLYFLSGPADPRRYADARAPLEKYTQLMPDDGHGWNLLGRTYYFNKMKDEAVAALTKAEALGGMNKDGYTILGRLHAEKKEWTQALEAFQKGDPSGRDLLIVGQMYVMQGQPGRADSIYRSVIAKDSTATDARFAWGQVGVMKFRGQDYPGAIDAFQHVIALDPRNDEAYYYIGLSRKEMKQYPEALDALRQAAALADGKADRQFWLGVLYAQSDSIPEAKRSLSRSLEIDSTSAFSGVAYRQLGFYDLLDKHYDAAIVKLDRATQLNSKDVQAWVWLAQGYQNSGNRSRALECYKKALEIDPKQADALKGIQSLSASAPKK